MRILFVALGTEQLNISLLASILRRAGHDVGLAFSRHLFDDRDQLSMPGIARYFSDDDDVVEQAARFRPDVVCYSALTVTYRWLIEVAQTIKDRCGAVSIFGGVHASAVPALVLEEPVVDYVCVGEGDFALPMLIAALAEGRRDAVIPNIAFRGPNGQLIKGGQMPFVQDLDSLPPFEKDLWHEHIAVDAAYLTMSSRGCPYRCTFCFNNFFANLGGARATSGKYVRQRSVDHFMAELVSAKRRYGIRYVHIIDDIFTLDTAWLQEFARRYRREINVPFQCLSHAHFLDAERVQALGEAGCVWVQIGVQSADEEYKKSTLRRPDKSARISQVLDLLHRAKIGVKTDHIFGLPGETIDSQDVALRFYAEHPGLRRVGTYWLTYLPGTQIIDEGLRAGTITQAQVDRINRGDTDFWHREANVIDPAMRRRYLEYEALLRVMVYLPASLRTRLTARQVRWLPAGLMKLLGLLISVTVSAAQRDPDLNAFLARYRHGLVNHVRRRLGLASRRRFPPGETSPMRDSAWDSLFEATQAKLRAAPLPIETLPLPAAAIPPPPPATAFAPVPAAELTAMS
ncbi:MAG: radical SAM protein [bacterium]